MNWFKRHLNWTVVIALVLSFPIRVVFDAMTEVLVEVAGITKGDIPLWFYIIVFGSGISFIFLVLGVSGWALRQKKRSLLWIILTPIVLVLRNKNDMQI